jgi:hypothetical protein
MNAPTARKKASPKHPSGKQPIEAAFNKLQRATLAAGETLSTREDMRARWSSLQQAAPVTLLRHVRHALGEKAEWCAERAHQAFDCIDPRKDAEEEMLNWLTMQGELRAIVELIDDQTEEE